MAAPLFVCHSTVALCFYGSLGLLHEHSWLWSSTLLSLQAVSIQPTAVLSADLLSQPHIPALSPAPHQWTCLRRGTQGCGTDHLCRSHSVLPATDQLSRSPPSPRSSPSVPDDHSAGEGASLGVGTSLLLQLPQRHRSHSTSSFLFFFSFFHPTQLRRDLSCPFRCPRSSVSVQQLLCENCSIFD